MDVRGTAAQYSLCFSLLGPEEGALSPSSSSHTEEQDVDTVTMTTASLSQQRGGGSGTGGGEGGGEKRRMRREHETKRRTGGGGLGHPDLDLDLVEEEVQEEERRRSQTVRQKEGWDGPREQGRKSKSLPWNSARTWDTFLSEERVEEEHPGGGVKERKRRSETKSKRRVTEANREVTDWRGRMEGREEREESIRRHAKHSGSPALAQRAAFSFLGPMDDNDDRQHLSDSESETSFSEVSLSASSVTTAGGRKDPDWRRTKSPWDQANGPGPWLRPSPQRLTQVLTGSQLRGKELVGGLSL